MTTPRLLQHYEERYQDDVNKPVPTDPLVWFPNDRFQATVAALNARFTGSRILEVGCGNGRIAKSLLASGLPFASYTMSDLSQPRVSAARDNIKDVRFNISTLDVETDHNWPLDEGDQFDAILMVALIEHLIDPISAMIRLRRHVRPGGFVYILTPNVARWTKRLALLAGKMPSTASKQEGLVGFDGKPVDLLDNGHLHYFTFRSLSRMLTERCGFSRCVPVPYWEGTRVAPKFVEHGLAWVWPQMFSELAVAAYVD